MTANQIMHETEKMHLTGKQIACQAHFSGPVQKLRKPKKARKGEKPTLVLKQVRFIFSDLILTNDSLQKPKNGCISCFNITAFDAMLNLIHLERCQSHHKSKSLAPTL